MNFLGAFLSTKTSPLNVRQLPVANGTAFSKISKQEVNFARYSQIFEKFFSGISRIFGWMARISEIQQFPEVMETFPGNFCIICRCFQFFESFGGMERAQKERFPFSPEFLKFRLNIKWNGPFRFGPTAIFGTSFKGGPLWPVGSFWSVGPKCPFPCDKIVVPSTALFHPAYKGSHWTIT